MEISVCVGSSCHIKGSYSIINRMKEKISYHHLEDKVNLKASFCLGKCSSSGVSIKIDDEVVCGVSTDNFDDVFQKYILEKLAI